VAARGRLTVAEKKQKKRADSASFDHRPTVVPRGRVREGFHEPLCKNGWEFRKQYILEDPLFGPPHVLASRAHDFFDLATSCVLVFCLLNCPKRNNQRSTFHFPSRRHFGASEGPTFWCSEGPTADRKAPWWDEHGGSEERSSAAGAL
jgi:hypothetical protein